MKPLSARLVILIGLAIFGYAEAWGANMVPIPPIHGTAIAALWTENEIVVAADSGLTAGENVAPELTCKIRQFGSVLVATHGITEYRYGSPSFNIWDVVSLSVQNHEGVAAAAKSFESLIIDPVRKTLNQMSLFDLKDYLQLTLGIRSIVGAIFFGIENGALVLSYRSVRQVPGGFEIVGTDYPNQGCLDFCFLLMGDNTHDDDEFKNANFSGALKDNLADVAHKYVQMVIDKGGVKYRPPIDIISVTKGGARWIQKKEECLEIKK